MPIVWHKPLWVPENLPCDLEGNTKPGYICIHQLENGNGQCGGNVFELSEAFGNHSCYVPDKSLLKRLWARLRG